MSPDSIRPTFSAPPPIAVVGLESEASAKTLANLAVGGFKGEIHTLPGSRSFPTALASPCSRFRPIKSAAQ